jgi:hypothetical protein
VRLRGRAEITVPALQDWSASSDGRTLVGAGDPAAFEPLITRQVVVFRDGRRVAALEEELALESEITVGDDGRVAIAGHAAGATGQSFALVLDTDGQLLFRHALAQGSLARDPVLFGDRLLVREHGIHAEGRGGSVLLVDAAGVRPLLDAPGALVLVGFPAAESALVQCRGELVWFDATSGRIAWRRALDVRPAGRHAWALWHSGTRHALAVVTAGLRRAGEPAARSVLLLLDVADGSTIERAELSPAGPVCEVDLIARADELVVDWRGGQEVFRWER